MAELSPASAGDAVARLLAAAGPILSLDIGSGTQDVLLALPGERAENWPRFVLPSPALGIADRIRRHTAAGRPVWLYGHNMGGGFAVAVQEQVAAGLAPAASPDAALALHDNPERVKAQGVSITPSCPKGYAAVPLADYEPGFWDGLLSAAGLPKPSLVVAAAQDHGHHPEGNRVGRFNLWRALLTETQGDPARWLYDTSPTPCTRLNALQQCTGGPVADTATAAVLGALAAPEVAKRSQRQGVTVVNVGNSHVAAFLVFKGRILGVYEHHTGMLDTDALLFDLKEFGFGWLPDEQVRAKGGHGCAFLAPLPPEAEDFAPTFAVGPRREMLLGHAQFIAPHGDMMIAGCHGLLHGLALREA